SARQKKADETAHHSDDEVRQVAALPDELPPPRKAEDEKLISLHLDDLEIRKALEILSRDGAFNLLVSPSVAGRVTANLKNVTPTQALEAVLRLTNLVAQRQGNLIYIYTSEDLRAGLGVDQWIGTRV